MDQKAREVKLRKVNALLDKFIEGLEKDLTALLVGILDLDEEKPVKEIEPPANRPICEPFNESFGKFWKVTHPNGTESQVVTKSVDKSYTVIRDAKDCIVQLEMFCSGGLGTTKNSKYSRCELREMDGKGGLASWSLKDQRRMVFTFEVTTISPDTTTVIGQIHDDKDDVIMIRFDTKKKIYEVTHNSEHYGVLASAEVGALYYVEIVTTAEGIDVYCMKEKMTKVSIKKQADKCYFKVGNYLQSLDKNAFANVVIHSISLN